MRESPDCSSTRTGAYNAELPPTAIDVPGGATVPSATTQATELPWSMHEPICLARTAVENADTARTRADEPGASAADSRATWPRIDGFEIRGRLGEGGMGEVYRAFDRKLKVEVALKVPRRLTHEAQVRFLEEAQKLAQVEHRNVVAIRTSGESNGHVYFTMNLVSGPSASRLIHRFGKARAHRLPLSSLLELAEVEPGNLASELRAPCTERRPYYRLIAHWIAEAAEGLAAAHRREILHRDIKPGNFLLASDGRLMVSDFGLAKTAKEIADSSVAGVQGTYPYVAPERILEGQAPVDHRADLWALGATLFEFLTYRRVYPRAGKGVLKDIVTKSPARPRSILSAVPIGLEDICLKAMNRDPDERFQSAGEMAAALYQWAGTAPRRWPTRTLSGCLIACAGAAAVLGAHAPTRDWVLTHAARFNQASGESFQALEISPALMVLNDDRSSIDLRDILTVRGRHVDQSVASIDLAQCQLSAVGTIVALDGTRIRALAPGREQVQIRYGGQYATLAVRVEMSASPPVGPPIDLPDARDSERRRVDEPEQASPPKQLRVFLALNEDLNTRDHTPASPGGTAARVLNEQLTDAAFVVEVGWSDAAWNAKTAVASAAERGADVVVFGTLTAYPKDRVQVSYETEPIVGWELAVELQLISLRGGERRFVSATDVVHPSARPASGTLPGDARELRNLVLRAGRGDGKRMVGVIGVLTQWLPPAAAADADRGLDRSSEASHD